MYHPEPTPTEPLHLQPLPATRRPNDLERLSLDVRALDARVAHLEHTISVRMVRAAAILSAAIPAVLELIRALRGGG